MSRPLIGKSFKITPKFNEFMVRVLESRGITLSEYVRECLQREEIESGLATQVSRTIFEALEAHQKASTQVVSNLFTELIDMIQAQNQVIAQIQHNQKIAIESDLKYSEAILKHIDGRFDVLASQLGGQR